MLTNSIERCKALDNLFILKQLNLSLLLILVVTMLNEFIICIVFLFLVKLLIKCFYEFYKFVFFINVNVIADKAYFI